ncbi:MAG: hypothetical protein ACOYXA_17635 [Bacteroidota bacterium]
MDVKQKYQIVEKIIQTDDDLLLSEIRSLLGLSGDFWNDLPLEVKKNIDVAKTELEEGKEIEHDQVMREAREKYLK